MIFTQLSFFLFFIFTFCAYWALPPRIPRKILLLVTSAFFYSMWNWRFLPLLLGITLVDYFAALLISRAESPAYKKLLLLVSLMANIGILCVFKYFDFFVNSAARALDVFGLGFHHGTLGLIIPLGISFHTFQAMSYTIDVYRGRIRPVTSVLDFSLFITFFPQLVAGPIVRAKDFFPALKNNPAFASLDFRGLFLLFLAGFFKKAVVADNLAPFVDSFFSSPLQYSTFTAWTAVFTYCVQIYCDFSGYSDMAIACAGLLGFTLPANFRHPYFSRNLTEFWRRWHISLSSWFHDYVYLSLGGNRVSKLITFRNIVLTLGLSGLWHGANWQFVAWGLMHAGGLSVQKVFSERIKIGTRGKLFATVAVFLTFSWFAVSMVFFRAHGLSGAMDVFKRCFVFASSGRELFTPFLYVFGVVVCALHVFTWKWPNWRSSTTLPAGVYYFFLGVAFAVSFIFANLTYRPFIYFQF